MTTMDYDIQRSTRQCAITGRELAEGEACYSALVAEGPQLRRLDYAVDAWTGPPDGALAWWKSRVPTRENRKPRLAPNEALLEMLRSLEGDTEKQDMRLVLALLLVRRRVLRVEQQTADAAGHEILSLYCPREEANYRVEGAMPSIERIQQIQDELTRLLDAGPT